MIGDVCGDVWTHLPSIQVLNLGGEVWVEGVLWGKVLKVLTVGQVIAHIHVKQEGSLVGPGGRQVGMGSHMRHNGKIKTAGEKSLPPLDGR